MVHIMASDFNERHFMSKFPVYMSKTFPKHRMTVPRTGIYQDIRYQKKTIGLNMKQVFSLYFHVKY